MFSLLDKYNRKVSVRLVFAVILLIISIYEAIQGKIEIAAAFFVSFLIAVDLVIIKMEFIFFDIEGGDKNENNSE